MNFNIDFPKGLRVTKISLSEENVLNGDTNKISIKYKRYIQVSSDHPWYDLPPHQIYFTYLKDIEPFLIFNIESVNLGYIYLADYIYENEISKHEAFRQLLEIAHVASKY